MSFLVMRSRTSKGIPAMVSASDIPDSNTQVKKDVYKRQDMTEGQIVQWNKKVREFVKEGEVLLEIMTDKVSMELEMCIRDSL